MMEMEMEMEMEMIAGSIYDGMDMSL